MMMVMIRITHQFVSAVALVDVDEGVVAAHREELPAGGPLDVAHPLRALLHRKHTQAV